jgi:hypothetical protein
MSSAALLATQLAGLPRRELQALAKAHGVRANASNADLAAQLSTQLLGGGAGQARNAAQAGEGDNSFGTLCHQDDVAKHGPDQVCATLIALAALFMPLCTRKP